MGFPTLPQSSTVAGQVDLLLLILISLSAFFTSIVIGLIIYFSIKYRRSNRTNRENPSEGNTKVELGWIFGLLILSAGVFVYAASIYIHIMQPPKNAYEIYVVGKQWMWKFQHPEGQQEIDELHVPVGTDIRLIMGSEDVIHSFYVPGFRIKYDVIPGRYTSIWFNATQPGEYDLFCAEYCGTNHSLMRGKVIVMTQADYQNWLKGGTTASTGGDMTQAGQALYDRLGCDSCHGTAGQRAPELQGLFGDQTQLSSGEKVQVDENYLRESILYPERQIAAGYPKIMPTYSKQLTEEELMQLVAYIKSMSGQPNSTGAWQNPNSQVSEAGSNN